MKLSDVPEAVTEFRHGLDIYKRQGRQFKLFRMFMRGAWYQNQLDRYGQPEWDTCDAATSKACEQTQTLEQQADRPTGIWR